MQAAQALLNKATAERRQFLAGDVALLDAAFKDFRGAGRQRVLEYETQATGYANFGQLTDFWSATALKAAKRQQELDRYLRVPAGKRSCPVCSDGLSPGDACRGVLPD